MKTHLGKYQLLAELGAGGMGRVYKAYEPALDRYVAIKQLSDTHLHDPVLVERFLREARAMAALNDPHILQVFAIEPDEEPPYFVMEFVDGESLSSLLLRTGRLPAGDALKILYGASLGLHVAHDHDLIHRDIKPANLMLTRRGQVKIADFGIVLDFRRHDAKLTGTGEFVGTPGYLPPEIWLGQPSDARTDIFALGVALYEMLAGHTPFTTESPYKLMDEVVNRDAPDVRSLNAAVEPAVAAILQRMLARQPEQRYPDVRALIAELERLPDIRQGGPLQTAIAGPSGRAAAQVDRRGSVTPGAGSGNPAALNTSVGLRPPIAATPAATAHPEAPRRSDDAATPGIDGSDAASAFPSPAPDRRDAPTVMSTRPPRRSWWPWLVGAAVVVAALVWLTGGPSPDIAGNTLARAQQQGVPWLQAAMTRGHAVQGLLATWLAPVVDRLGLPIRPRVAANLVLAAIAITLLNALWQSFRRLRARRRRPPVTQT